MPLAGKFVRASDGWREVGYAEITAVSNTTTGGPVDTTSLTVTVDVVTGRAYLILFNYNGVRSTVAGDQIQLTICDGTNARLAGTGRVTADTANVGNNGGMIAAHDLPSTGTKTYKIRHERITGTGSVSVNAAADLKSWIQVIDLAVPA